MELFGCEDCTSKNKGKVIDTRHLFDVELKSYTIIRRRQCLVCGARWTTVGVNRKNNLKKDLTSS